MEAGNRDSRVRSMTRGFGTIRSGPGPDITSATQVIEARHSARCRSVTDVGITRSVIASPLCAALPLGATRGRNDCGPEVQRHSADALAAETLDRRFNMCSAPRDCSNIR